MRSEISFDHHSFQNDPGMTVFCHSDLILSFETKDERNEVDKVPYRDPLPKCIYDAHSLIHRKSKKVEGKQKDFNDL